MCPLETVGPEAFIEFGSDKGQPVIVLAIATLDAVEIACLQHFGYRAAAAITDLPAVEFSNRRDLGRGFR